MQLRLVPVVVCLVALTAFPVFASGASDLEYANLAKKILDRIGALPGGKQKIDWTEEIKRAKVGPDGTGGFAIEHGVQWVLDRPAEPPSKLNGRRAVYQPGGFWIYLTFYRGPWGGAAVFQSVDFGDLHLWLDYGYKDDPAAIVAIAKIVEEERRAFEQTLQPKSNSPRQPTEPPTPKTRGG